MAKGLISEYPVTQENPQEAFKFPVGTVKITIKCLLTSAGNCVVGWGSKNSGNLLVPGESVTYFANDGCGNAVDLSENQLYISFDNVSGVGGKALVSSIIANT
jgi:hypothetical protein